MTPDDDDNHNGDHGGGEPIVANPNAAAADDKSTEPISDPVPTPGPIVLLSTPSDATWLTPLLCLIRDQIEVFPATPLDVAARFRQGGIKQSVSVGRVGLRCRHCASVSRIEDRARGSVSYPKSVRLFYQAVRNWQRYHFPSCPYMPADVRAKYEEVKGTSRQSRGTTGLQRWVEAAQSLGLVDATDAEAGGVRFGEGGDGRADGDDGGGGRGAGEGAAAGAGAGAAPPSPVFPVASTATATAAVTPLAVAAAGSALKMPQIPQVGLSSVITEGGRERIDEKQGGVAGSGGREQPQHLLSQKDPPQPLPRRQQPQPRNGNSISSSHRHHHHHHITPPSPPSSPSTAPFQMRSVSDTNSAAQSSGGTSSTTNVDDISIDEFKEWLPPTMNAEGCISFGSNHTNNSVVENAEMATTAGVLGVSPSDADGMLFPAPLGDIQANNDISHYISMPPAGPMSVERDAAAAFGATEQTGPSRERGDGRSDLDEKKASLLESVRFAAETVKRVRQGHDAGFVAYGSSVGGNGSNLSGESIRRDLVALGINLFRHFAGVDPSDANIVSNCTTSNRMEGTRADLVEGPSIAEGTHAKKKERRSAPHKYVRLRDLGFPVSLCLLVSSLLDVQDDDAVDRYQTTQEVEKDILLMIANPERYLFDAAAEKLKGHLEFPAGKLYGREQDLSRLMGVFHSAFDCGTSPHNPSQMILVSGYSGMGKTVLVDQLRIPLAERNGHFISGKFDELGQAQPMSIIFSAFNDFCSNLLARDEGQISQMRKAINDALGPDVNVLTGLIPNLSTVMGVTIPSTFDVGGREALNRFIFHFRLFLRAIASPSHPVILFLDDLQWADKATLELITMIVLEGQSRSLLFVGSYRDNEVGGDHPLNEAEENIASAGVSITNVNLHNVDRESVNLLTSDTINLSPRLSQSLANFVYVKTIGNPLFVVQFLRSLCDEHLLKFSASSRRWEWDVEAIQSKDIAHNVVDLMKHKMLRLDPAMQKLLKEASCLGSRFETSTLKLLSSDGDSNGSDIEHVIDPLVDEGLICRMGSSFKFPHDRIKEAAYSLIPASEQEFMHLHIGRLLWKQVSTDELESIIFIIVDQLHRGSNLISDHAEKVGVAGLCLVAGKKAMSSSAFLQASIYLLQGTALLDESDWEHHYDLSLQVFTCCAEALYVNWNFDGVVITTNPILKHGRSLHDKLCAYCTLLNSLGSQGKQRDALDIGLELVAQLGESFPKEIDRDDAIADYNKTICMLRCMVPANSMEDANMMGIMKILSILARQSYEVDQLLLVFINDRLVQLSLRHGICKESAFGFASQGAICSAFGDTCQGYKNGKLALSLLDQSATGSRGTEDQLPRVYIVVYGMLFIYAEPAQASLPSLKRAYEVGMAMGDIDFGLYNASTYVLHSLQCGSKLEMLAEEARSFTQQMKENKHNQLHLMQPCLQTILNLKGCAGDPITHEEVMDQEELLNHALEKDQLLVAYRIYFFRMWLAYLFRRYDAAEDTARKCQKQCELVPVRLETQANDTFYIGLIAAALARKGNQDEWRSVAFDAAEKMKTWAGNSSWNFDHKLHLLNAENAYLNGDLGGAAKAYDDAILVAGEHGFVHEQALACERAGIFYSEAINADTGIEYFKRSHKHYVEWGAQSKADDLLEILSDQ